jgi:hypothetical protein
MGGSSDWGVTYRAAFVSAAQPRQWPSPVIGRLCSEHRASRVRVRALPT